ncbi:MAG: hypothetical protein IK954_03005 [Clostridia bacterium]|nr:hypothetical protein [Clostridia bacterium]
MKRLLCLLLCLCLLTACTAPHVRDTDLPKDDDYNTILPPVGDEPSVKDYTDSLVHAAVYPTGMLLCPVEEYIPAAFTYNTASAVLSAAEGNVGYSPASLYFALTMFAEGATGETAKELDALLGERGNVRLLYDKLYNNSDTAQLKIANSLWMSKNFTFREDFVNTIRDDHRASLLTVDFGEDANAQMTQWVSDQTAGLLKPTFQTDELTVLSLINTLYFKVGWQEEFSSCNDLTFRLPDGTTATAAAMSRTWQSAVAYKTENATRVGVILPEIGWMWFVLPDEGVALDTLTASPEALQTAFNEGETQDVKLTLTLPKVDTEVKLDLRPVLSSLGCEAMFVQPNADLSGFVEGGAALSVTGLAQGTRIAWDEKGVTGAAFTEILCGNTSLPPQRPALDLTFDRPFLYGVFSDDGDALFIGAMTDPDK